MVDLGTREGSPQRLSIVVRGVVQGVGFRPFVYRAARRRGLAGWVLNEADTVQIEIQGPPSEVRGFVDALRPEAPPQARIESVEVREIPRHDEGDGSFVIRGSTAAGTPRPTIPADLATCPECLAEIRDSLQRRHGYPFTNCTRCGPRWSIITQLPYDRPRTSMAQFGMCPDCRREYEDPDDRRFHAQPIACPECGPTLTLLGRSGQQVAQGAMALFHAVSAILAGQILALKGLGGFQLLVDATCGPAVAELRRRKRRPDRPLALMFHSLAEARRWCEVSKEEARVLRSPQAPIVLLRRRRDGPLFGGLDIVPAVAPENPWLGIMLPSTPLHHLLMDGLPAPVVCTSGNLAEEPMAIELAEGRERLGQIADLMLVHDRPIVRPVDDSVVRVGPAGLQVLRRARGFAPLPIMLDSDGPVVLATGGHLKNTVALALGAEVVLSAHVGDLESALGVEVHRRAIQDLVDFFQATPAVIACDLHPDYASTRTAEALAARGKLPLVRVQHHHAHVAACMAEHALAGPLLGLSWDGTGYGSDGTIWGGEVLICEGADFSRAAHLRTFSLPGGDRAVRQPRRSALGVLFEIDPERAWQQGARWFSGAELSTLRSLLERSLRAPRTSSMGRLFDAIAALGGLPPAVTFEGQAAMALQFAAEEFAEEVGESYPLPVGPGRPAIIDWEPLVRGVLDDQAAGEPLGLISRRFHNALAELAVTLARRHGLKQVVLTGGCFQNALLSDRTRQRLTESGFEVFTHARVPPGDGGIALGQVLVASRKWRQGLDFRQEKL